MTGFGLATLTSVEAIFCKILQAVVTALDLPWEEASHLLKHAGGDLSAAFKNELSAYHLNEKLLDELVWEYAAHRSVATDSAPCFKCLLREILNLCFWPPTGSLLITQVPALQM